MALELSYVAGVSERERERVLHRRALEPGGPDTPVRPGRSEAEREREREREKKGGNEGVMGGARAEGYAAACLRGTERGEERE